MTSSLPFPQQIKPNFPIASFTRVPLEAESHFRAGDVGPVLLALLVAGGHRDAVAGALLRLLHGEAVQLGLAEVVDDTGA